ncbi:MAG: tripartite tricarboxylate transporter substrate binding protein [Betaproteobacteria bacterium]|nr:tripartite tricarboxylate transporter substrate binding protein [Betaproteobacteria bacterium]
MPAYGYPQATSAMQFPHRLCAAPPIGIGVLAILLALACTVSQAQTFPSRTVRVIVPNAAGGPSDLVGRVIAQKLSEGWGQPVVVENRVGAGGNIGVDAVAKAAPDGYTLLATNSAPIVVNQSLYAKIPYDPLKDLATISLLASAPMVLVVPASSPANSMAELIRYAKANPGKLTFGSLGSGTGPHLAAEMFRSQSGIDILHVPYRSVSQVHAALMVGELSMHFDVPTVLSQVQAGKMKALAVTVKSRFGLAPNVPTVVESGLPDYEMSLWYGLLAPSGIGSEVKAQIHAATMRVLALPEVQARMTGIGFEVVRSTPEQFSAHIQAESARWANLIKATGIPQAN